MTTLSVTKFLNITGTGVSCTASDSKKPDVAAMTTEHEVPMVRPGDASIAAPFTSRVPSIRSVVQLIRQVRYHPVTR